VDLFAVGGDVLLGAGTDLVADAELVGCGVEGSSALNWAELRCEAAQHFAAVLS